MSMFTERLQILISKEQRQLLEREAKVRGSSVASVIRDAVDHELGGSSRAEKLRAIEAIRQVQGVPYLPPEDLAAAIERSHDEEILRGLPGLTD